MLVFQDCVDVVEKLLVALFLVRAYSISIKNATKKVIGMTVPRARKKA